jgi:1-deoxy-D-xylulose-5-phosphate synthase
MKDGTGLSRIEELFPNNFIDVGIAEEYAVTLSAGMSAGGIKPVVCIYSTFMQRAYDQILHDVCIPNLPVVFCIDRAGLIGADGKTHQGVFDLSYLSHLPNLQILAPSNLGEFKDMLRYALNQNSPVAIRYPATDVEDNSNYKKFDSPDFEIISEGEKVNILAVGPRMVNVASQVANAMGQNVGVINARSIKPLDQCVLEKISSGVVVTLEENSLIGGFGSLVKGYYSQKGKLTQVYSYGVGDAFVSHGDIQTQLEANCLSVQAVIDDLNKKLKV